MLINIGSGSKLKFNRLKITRNPNSSEVNAENGTINVQVSSGTKISLFKTSRYKSELVFENGEIWCTERYMRGGPGGAVAVGFLGFAYLVISEIGRASCRERVYVLV